MTDPRKLDPEAMALVEAPLTLQERMAIYGKIFAFGIVGIMVVGSIAGVLTPSTIPVAIGYTAVFTGAVMLLAGGASGGGYANLGFGLVERAVDMARGPNEDRSRAGLDRGPATGGPPAGRASKKYDVASDEDRRRRDPMERLRRGLRPEKNPAAFWTVIGGFVYIALGSLLVIA
jgi:hypothetical protein